ncbi:MAG: glycosyltransferase family 4 protein [Myxococcota bacterium]|nr:glycosyltransferase family 4 protein [Myxococcota bacterium]MEC8422475.1 glycosyltransferase family 4 protein [Myxococcota bacterium]
MRVAYLLPAPGIPVQGPSGASAHVRGIVRAMRASHDVRLYAARGEDHRGRFGVDTPARLSGVPPWPTVLGRWRDQQEVLAARRVADAVMADAWAGWAPEVVIERHTLFSDAGWRIHHRLGVPWVLEVNAPPTVERARYEELRRPSKAEEWERRVLQAAPVVIAVSRWLVRWLKEEVGCRNVVWVPNGVDPVKGDRARGRALLGVSSDEPLIGYVGSRRQWHDIASLARVADAAGARLVLAGQFDVVPGGALAPGHLGPQDLADVIAALDVGMAPYQTDSPAWFCPLKVLGYRAQGTPVVATALGDVPALVEDGGSVVPAGDHDALVTSVCAWMGRRVTPRVRSWRTVAREVLELGLGG